MRDTFVLSCFVLSFASSGLTGPVKKCQLHDTNCIKQSAQELLPKFAVGLPELGVQSLDPLVLTKDIDASSPNLKLVVKNLVVKGLKDCVVKKFEHDVQKFSLKGRYLCNVEANGDYEMHGNLLFIAVEGQGKAKVVLNKIQMEVEDSLGEKMGKDGKKHWYVKDSKFNYKLKDKAYLNFENLFKDNKVLAQAAYDLINSSPNEIVMEIGQPVVKAIVDKIVENVNKFYQAVPIEDLINN